MTKSQHRENCLQRLKNSAQRYRAHHDVRQRLEQVLAGVEAKNILFFWPLGMEADVRATVQSWRKKGEVYLPFMEGVSFKMVPFRYPLERKRFGIYEPRFSLRHITTIDVAVIPVIGVDRSLGRIGFGKGMYDRFFERLKLKPLKIFVQIFPCRTLDEVCEPHDIRADVWITPRATYYQLRNDNDQRTTRRRWCSHPKRVGRFFNFKKNFNGSFRSVYRSGQSQS